MNVCVWMCVYVLLLVYRLKSFFLCVWQATNDLEHVCESYSVAVSSFCRITMAKWNSGTCFDVQKTIWDTKLRIPDKWIINQFQFVFGTLLANPKIRKTNIDSNINSINKPWAMWKIMHRSRTIPRNIKSVNRYSTLVTFSLFVRIHIFTTLFECSSQFLCKHMKFACRMESFNKTFSSNTPSENIYIFS